MRPTRIRKEISYTIPVLNVTDSESEFEGEMEIDELESEGELAEQVEEAEEVEEPVDVEMEDDFHNGSFHLTRHTPIFFEIISIKGQCRSLFSLFSAF